MNTGDAQAGVRGGGRQGADRYVFELSGGHPALDLANTLDLRPTPEPAELLKTFEDSRRLGGAGPPDLGRRARGDSPARG